MFGISIKKSVAVGFGVGLMALATQAGALTQADQQYLGLVNDGIPSNPTDEVSYINTLIGLASPSGPTAVGTETYTRSANDCGPTASDPCPTANTTGATKDESGDNTINVGDFEYLVAKYDASDAGSLVFWVGNLDGNQTVPEQLNGKDLSHISLYNAGTITVPEPMSLALLALGFLGLAFARRRVTS